MRHVSPYHAALGCGILPPALGGVSLLLWLISRADVFILVWIISFYAGIISFFIGTVLLLIFLTRKVANLSGEVIDNRVLETILPRHRDREVGVGHDLQVYFTPGAAGTRTMIDACRRDPFVAKRITRTAFLAREEIPGKGSSSHDRVPRECPR